LDERVIRDSATRAVLGFSYVRNGIGKKRAVHTVLFSSSSGAATLAPASAKWSWEFRRADPAERSGIRQIQAAPRSNVATFIIDGKTYEVRLPSSDTPFVRCHTITPTNMRRLLSTFKDCVAYRKAP